MRTVFVNPGKPRRRKASKRRAKRRNVVARAVAPKRRRRRAKRRNAGIAPFVSARRNPLILSNPRRRSSKRRRNPGLPNLKQAATKVLQYSGGSAMGAALNIFLFRNIENPFLRHGARILAALGGGMFLSSEMGGAMAGATLYPSFAELALALGVGGDISTEADLNELAADLEQALQDADEEMMYVP